MNLVSSVVEATSFRAWRGVGQVAIGIVVYVISSRIASMLEPPFALVANSLYVGTVVAILRLWQPLIAPDDYIYVS
ncbi:uncharacterized protein BJ171DRAFT_489533, partial [Polychytrium aggregatum]|uniref:uncharacterized protein n=1 Tax=Polychytrium aggregatum TaxID=110093 RepID=UPI0022FE3FFB